MDELIVRKTIRLKASVAEVWDALTNPDKTVKYMFACRVFSDWEVGGPVLWNGIMNGVEITFVRGVLLKYEPMSVLEYTTFNPHNPEEEKPEHHPYARYELEPEGDETVLHLTQGEFSKLKNGQKRYEDTMVSWDKALALLKVLVEDV